MLRGERGAFRPLWLATTDRLGRPHVARAIYY